jgi:hypothetical protein
LPQSPFRSYKNETREPYRSRNADNDDFSYIDNSNNINDILDILEYISKSKFITSKQIFDLYSIHCNLSSDDNQNNIRRKYIDKILKFLQINGLVSYYEFKHECSKNNPRVYFLELKGNRYLHEKRNILYNAKFKTDIPIHVIKRYLAANQVFTYYKSHKDIGEIIDYCIYKQLFNQVNNAWIMNIILNVVMDKNGLIYNINHEIIRRKDSGWKYDFLNRLNRYQQYYDTIEILKNQKHRLIIIGEDEEHIVEIYEEMIKNGVYLRNAEIVFSCDLRFWIENDEPMIKFNYGIARNNYIIYG